MTSVIDNPGKVADYIMVCRSMKIQILPPDINEGEASFSVSGGAIRYALDAIKSIGRPVIDAILKERQKGGPYASLKSIGRPVIDAILKERQKGGPYASLRSFAERVGDQVNKRAAENFIKAGAFDCFGATRKQMMMTYAQIFDAAARERKNQVSGQLSLFDFLKPEDGEGDAGAGQIPMPDVGEFSRDQRLKMEKEVLGIYVSGHPLESDIRVLGIYVSGHPLESDISVWEKNITAKSHDFAINDETGQADRLQDSSDQVIGGILQEKTIKYTKKGQTMAFITLEDLVGSVEVLVFPKLYEQYSELLNASSWPRRSGGLRMFPTSCGFSSRMRRASQSMRTS